MTIAEHGCRLRRRTSAYPNAARPRGTSRTLLAVRPDLQPFVDEIRALVPEGAELVDVHTHLGVDDDGHRLDPPTLLRQLDAARIARACVFPLHDPERVPGYRVPNDRVLAWAGESGGRLFPFCRLDPASGGPDEAERCIARGARGIKLHLRAESPGDGDHTLDTIFALAATAGVPVLVHAGRGMAPITEDLCDIALRHPAAPLILAHAAMADQAAFASRLAGHPAAFYDTSAFGALDLIELYARVPSERILFGSDPPYGKPLLGLYMTLRVAALAGVPPDGMRALLGGTTTALLEGRPAPSPTAPRRPRTITMAGPLARIHRYGSMAFADLGRGDAGSARENIALARSVCRDPDPGPAGPAMERIRPALDAVATALDRPGGRVPRDVLYLVAALAATEPVLAA
jgi:predicted TIM-barrel fold metal-dependent hydrolase